MVFNTQRWTLANILPVAFVVKIVLCLELLYVFLHLVPLLQGAATQQQGVWQTAVSQTLALLMLTCLLRAIMTDPGSVPNTPEWQSSRPENVGRATEVKQTGEARFCKWCNQYKPDRCHHCRVCRSCVLRMDHHCPWIANCVGFRNHKFFLLLVFYAMLNCLFIVATMSETMTRAVNEEMTPLHRFGIVYCMTLGTLMSVLLVPFFLLHVNFMTQAQSTIEFCEKRSKKTSISYDLGVMENMKAALGPNMLLWLLPISPPEGDGLSFPTKTEALLPNEHVPANGAAQPAASSDDGSATINEATPADDTAESSNAILSSSRAEAKGASKGKADGPDAIDSAPEVTGARASEV